jgi:hypothetical protein
MSIKITLSSDVSSGVLWLNRIKSNYREWAEIMMRNILEHFNDLTHRG